jgi:hypothetical protein
MNVKQLVLVGLPLILMTIAVSVEGLRLTHNMNTTQTLVIRVPRN